MKIKWNFLGGGGAKQKLSVGGGYGYFLKLHNDLPWGGYRFFLELHITVL